MKGGFGLFLGLAVAGFGLVFGQPVVIAIGLAGAVGSLFIASARATQSNRAEMTEDRVRPDQRVLIRPLRKLRDDISGIVQANKESTSVKVIGVEALAEADRILNHCVDMLALQARVRPNVTGRDLNSEIKQLEEQLISTQEPQYRETLDATLSAKKLELEADVKMRQALTQIDANLQRAHAALSEMKARLSVSATQSQEFGMDESLNDTISRMKSLSASFDEAEELLRIHSS